MQGEMKLTMTVLLINHVVAFGCVMVTVTFFGTGRVSAQRNQISLQCFVSVHQRHGPL